MAAAINQSVELVYGTPLLQPTTVDPNHEGEDGMGVRDGVRQSPDAPKKSSDPLWMLQLEWPAIVHDPGLGHPLKFIWEEKAQHLTTYSNFWKQFYRKLPWSGPHLDQTIAAKRRTRRIYGLPLHCKHA